MQHLQKPITFFFVLIIVIFAVLSCSDDDSGEPSETFNPPTLPEIDSVNTGESSHDSPYLNPEQEGPYLVGNTSFIVEDPSRALSCGKGNRRLVVEAWYPAGDEAVDLPQNTILDFFLTQRQAGLDAMVEHGHFADENDDYPTGSYRDAPLHPDATKMPLLIFSHGFTSNRFQNYTLCNYLAGHGYLVLSPDHTCNSLLCPFPDEPLPYSLLNAPITLFERKDDISFLIDLFTQSPPAMFEGKIDSQKVAIFGHSFGGFTMTEAIKTEPRAMGLVQLAAFGFPWNVENVSAPSMYFIGDQDGVMAPWANWRDQNRAMMPKPKWALTFKDTGHFAFSDLCVYSRKLADGGDGCGDGNRLEDESPFTNPGHEQMHDVINPYVTAFFGWLFFEYEELEEYLMQNSTPDLVTMESEVKHDSY